MQYQFTKMHSLGNDFVVMDGTAEPIHMTESLARFLADRKWGIGCDQILVAEKPNDPDNDFIFSIYNQNGSQSGQCGNGARCFARFLLDNHLTTKKQIKVSTIARSMQLMANDDGSYSVDMGLPEFVPADIPLAKDEEQIQYCVSTEMGEVQFCSLSMGNPHAVIRVDDVNAAPVETLGPLMECHTVFPERANIGFMEIVNHNHIKLRVYERGVGETQACGSGASAATVAGCLLGELDSQVTVSLPGGDVQVNWEGRGTPVLLSGSAVSVFEGQVEVP